MHTSMKASSPPVNEIIVSGTVPRSGQFHFLDLSKVFLVYQYDPAVSNFDGSVLTS